jgi:hypothetical protein
MNAYEEALDDWVSHFAEAAALDSELDTASGALDEQSLAYEAMLAEDDSDRLTSLKQLPQYVAQPPLADIPREFRNIGYGEITSTSPAASRTGLANLNQDLIYREADPRWFNTILRAMSSCASCHAITAAFCGKAP